MIADGEDDGEDDEAYYEGDDPDQDEDAFDAEALSDDDTVDVLAQDFDPTEDPELADAFATILDRRKKGGKSGSGGKGSAHAPGIPFEALSEEEADLRLRRFSSSRPRSLTAPTVRRPSPRS